MADFKFQIGQLVTTKIGVAEAIDYCRAGQFRVPIRGVVVERVAQECSGGVQLRYKLANGSGENADFLEVALADLSEFDVEKHREIAAAALLEQRKRLWKAEGKQ
jgi:hypothetical protein